jgi:hypothetical protein
MRTDQVKAEIQAEEVAAMRLQESLTDTIRMLGVKTELTFPDNNKPITVKLVSSHFSMFLRHKGKTGDIDVNGKDLDWNYGLTEAQSIGDQFFTFLTTDEKGPTIYQSVATPEDLRWLAEVCLYRAERGIR